ncbi:MULTISPECIES: site-specific integrase [Moraxella]|uniref:Tyr recombinase domain-containing protein n=1 Tax=Moraxella catarrhalis TaxID=480 RepID=A0A7Z1A4Y4_MORCA|nr:site-specific integrase [Moraxella catarrhalis]OAV02208.1 hypothetical protein AO382_0574 [Moraxella catarrhalis]STY81899.1 Site-specific recombinase XerD [Moraxella catarrhalis]
MFTAQQECFIEKTLVPEKILLPFARYFDDKWIAATSDTWRIYYSGSREYINFPKDYLQSKLLKYFCYKYASVNMASSLRSVCSSWSECLSYCENIGEFNFLVLEDYLSHCKNSKAFASILFGIKILCFESMEGFSPNDYDGLEFIPRPTDGRDGIYSNAEMDAIDVFTKNLIATGLIKFHANLMSNKFNCNSSRSIAELRSMCILSICYISGARPSQIANLQAKDVRVDLASSKMPKYSLYITYAKQTKVRLDKILIAIPIEVAEILTFYIQQQALNGEDKLFPKHSSSPMQVYHAINKAILKLSPESYQMAVQDGLVAPPSFCASDFRHNVGQSLAMQGVSAEEISYILGHASLVSAKNYIEATPQLAMIRHHALGGNAVWQNMIAMMMTGSIVQSKTWSGVRVANFIGGKMHTEIGGCTYETDCPFSMVRNCYGCLYFRPFDDGNHEKLLKSTQDECDALIKLSDSVGCANNPLVQSYETTLIEIQSVINRCHVYALEKNNDSK